MDDDFRQRERSPVYPYLAMLAVPSSLALTGARRAGFLLLTLVALLYWLMIGFRFQVGADHFVVSACQHDVVAVLHRKREMPSKEARAAGNQDAFAQLGDVQSGS